MKKIIINRITSIPSTRQIVWENVTDFTHFIPLHWKHFKSFDLIYEQDDLKIFYYQSIVFYPFNFTKSYIGIRVLDAKNYSFNQIYYCPDEIKDSKMFLHAQLVEKGGRIEIHNRMIFHVTGIWAWWPKLFAWLVNYRSQRMWLEDREIIEVRNQLGRFNNETCLPPIESLHQEVVKNMGNFQELFTPSPGDCYMEFFVKEDSLPDNQK